MKVSYALERAIEQQAIWQMVVQELTAYARLQEEHEQLKRRHKELLDSSVKAAWDNTGAAFAAAIITAGDRHE